MCVCVFFFSLVDAGKESCGHVFLEVHGFTDTLCNIVTAAVCLSASQRVRIYFDCLGKKKPPRSPYCAQRNSRGKLSKSYDICCAQSLHGAACSRL